MEHPFRSANVTAPRATASAFMASEDEPLNRHMLATFFLRFHSLIRVSIIEDSHDVEDYTLEIYDQEDSTYLIVH